MMCEHSKVTALCTCTGSSLMPRTASRIQLARSSKRSSRVRSGSFATCRVVGQLVTKYAVRFPSESTTCQHVLCEDQMATQAADFALCVHGAQETQAGTWPGVVQPMDCSSAPSLPPKLRILPSGMSASNPSAALQVTRHYSNP